MFGKNPEIRDPLAPQPKNLAHETKAQRRRLEQHIT